MERPSISVIVPCRNAAAHLPALLRSLVDQVVEEVAEIVVVDNLSTDDSKQVAMQVTGRIPIRVVDATAFANGSYARNCGVTLAYGRVLMFVDADDEVAPGYVEAMAGALREARFVTSRVDSRALNAPWLWPAHGPHWQEQHVSTFFDFLPAAGANVALDRELFEAVGGFREDFPAAQDIALSWDVQALGVPIQFVPSAVYRYRYRDSIAGLFKQSARGGLAAVRLHAAFRNRGMPGRSWTQTCDDWRRAATLLLRARSRENLGVAIVQTGYCVGRIFGSILYRRAYF